MRPLRYFLLIAATAFILQSCEFNCSIGDKKQEEVKGAAVVKDGARIYNNIELSSSGVQVSKAYLVFANGDRVPDDNFVNFKSPVKMQLVIDSGWVEQNGKVLLGASEKITAEDGTVVLEEQDLFQKYPDGVSVTDSKSIYLSATVKLKEGAAPTSFTVSFRVWDKNGEGYVEGNYKLFSK
jgi:hypothetical protein